LHSVVTVRVGSALAALAALLLVAIPNAEAPPGVPFIFVEQGVTVQRIGGREVFVVRDGSVVSVSRA